MRAVRADGVGGRVLRWGFVITMALEGHLLVYRSERIVQVALLGLNPIACILSCSVHVNFAAVAAAAGRGPARHRSMAILVMVIDKCCSHENGESPLPDSD